MPDDADAARLQGRPGLPGREQILEHRVQLLLRRVPGLEQVVVQGHLVDGRDRRLGVRVGGQQHALGVGHDRPGLHQVLRPRHARHALVGDQQGHRVAAAAHLAQEIERLGARPGAQDAVALAEAAAQVARHRGQHGRLVVDGEDGGPALPWGGRLGLAHRNWLRRAGATSSTYSGCRRM
jgi:hypothetical protein